MRTYLITRTADRTDWGMTEVEAEQDIIRTADGTAMRAVLCFEAPDWESAKRVFDWVCRNVRDALLRRIRKPKTWDEVKELLD